jgi:UDP-N-acetylglucosamine acyltransferase
MKQHPTAIVSPRAELAGDVEVGPYCIIGPSVKLAAGVRLRSHVVIEGETEVGEGCEIYPFAALGGEPQHAAHGSGDYGRLIIGARNLIRENVTMHGGSKSGRGLTSVGDDCAFYVGSHVGHDCEVGDHVTLTNAATLAGHVRVEEYVILGGLAAVQQRARIGRHAFVGGMAGVNNDVIPFGMVWGNHANLEGLNLVGLKRRGFSRDTINALRAAYRCIFQGDGQFRDRVERAAVDFGDCPEAMEIVDFIRAEPTRPLTLPALAA